MVTITFLLLLLITILLNISCCFKVANWKSENPRDHFFFRKSGGEEDELPEPMGNECDDDNTDEEIFDIVSSKTVNYTTFLFCHQTKVQQHLMQR